nr:hypothetical protein [Tanacetum cinerariifolium]
MKIPLLEYFATVSAKEFPLLSCSVPPAEEFALLDEDKDYSQSKMHYSQSKTAPQEETGKGPASESSAKKKGRTVVITIEDMQKRINDVKARTTLLLALPDEHQLLQAIVSHLEFMDVEIEQDDLNQKLLTSLAPEWLITDVAAASISHDTICAYISSQSNGSQIKYEDITQIDKDDIEEIDIKWNMALLTMRADSYMAIEEDNYALVADDDAPTEFTLMAKSSSSSENEVYDDSYCSKSCRKNTENLNTKISKVNEELSDCENTLYHYKIGLSQAEARLVKFKTHEIKFCVKIRGFKRDVEVRNNKIENLMNELEQVKKEKEGLDNKLTGFESASKDLDTLLGSQRTDKNKEGLPEFVDDTVTGYSRPTPSIDSSKSNKSDLQNNNSYVSEHGESSSSIMSKPMIKFIKAADCPGVIKTNKTETARIPPVKYAEMYRNTSKSTKVKSNQRFPLLIRETREKLLRPQLVGFGDLNKTLLKKDNSQNNVDDKGYWDSGFSRHMTGNISYLSERLGHLNFKTMNKLVRNNLVKGLPSKCFENNHTYVACLKENQHKASCRTKLMNSVSKPLHTLHKDLFRPTSVSSLNHKWYCLVVTDDFSRCDNGGEFENKEMNEFSTKKWIKREFSNARTPQQNGGARRRNRTLIEVVRIMLADAKLLVTFWAEAVNAACYVQNRVLVNKSQNKTAYELFNSRTPSIGFLRPFGCHVMILNTLDHLGKFDAKGGEGYFVGYSMSSKAFRVFNKRTKKVEENLHVDFLKNKFIKKGAGPNWLFDIDTLTNSMNYVPLVVARTSSTNISSTKDLVSQGVKKDVSSLRYIALPNWFHEAHMESSNSDDQDACNADVSKMEFEFPTVSSPVPTVFLDTSPKTSSGLRLISKEVINQEETPSLDNALTLSNRFEDTIRVEADLSNMESGIPASPTPTFRIHKDHPKSQRIGPVDTPVQTRYKSNKIKEHSFIATIHQKTTLDLLQFCIFLSFLSQEEPKKIVDALKDPRIRPIGTKWVLKNKKDKRGIMIGNKARLVAQGHTQEKGIDYEEVFAQIARIEAIRLFLAYALFMRFTVYQMYVKSAFIYGTIDEEVYVMQPLGFQDPEFPDRVYKVEKAMYGLHQAPRAWYGTLSKYLLDNGFQRGTIDQTLDFGALMHDKFQMSVMGELTFFLGLQVLQKKDGIFLSQDKYVGGILKKFGYSDVRSMIRSLMYLTASRLDIMFAVCVCARHQVTPKECHLHDVKRIFRYLKGHPKLGLWYPKESPFDMVAYSESNYGGATQDRKSTTGGCQFLGRRLISWQCKKQTIMVTSTTEAEYVAAANGCGQVLLSKSREDLHESHHLFYTYFFWSSVRIETTNEVTKILATVDDESASLLRDGSQGEAFPTVSSLDAGQDRENINKTSALLYESSPKATSLDADEGNLEISSLKARVNILEDKDRGREEPAQEDAPIKGAIEAANILTSRVAAISVSPVATATTVGVPTVSGLILTVSAIFTTASVVAPYLKHPREIYAKDKGKEKLVESDVPKKKKLQEQIDAQVAREIEEEFARDNQRLSEQLARDPEIARLHAEEELKMMIEGLDRSNEMIEKHLHEYEQATADLSIREKIELINELEQREFYITVLRSHDGLKTRHLRGMTLEKIKEKFILVWKQIEYFVPMSSKEEGKRMKKKGLKLDQGSAKKINTFEDVPKEDLKGMMQLVPLEELEDLHQLWILVKETLTIKQATKDKEKELWDELKRLFEPDFKDQIWTHNQNFMHNPLEWKLYDTCGVHHVLTKD